MDGVCQKAAGSYRCGLFIFISVLSEIDSGRRLLQITVTKTLVSKGRILRKKMFISLVCKSLSGLKGFGIWGRCLMTGKLQTCQARMGMWEIEAGQTGKVT